MKPRECPGPFIQFFPGDFLKDPCVQVLTFEAKSIWLFMILLMHNASKRGFLVKANGKQISSKELANALQIKEGRVLAAWAEMEAAGTFSRTEDSIIYCRRMARATLLSEKRREAGRKGGSQPKGKQKSPYQNQNQNQNQKSESESDSFAPVTASPIADSPVVEKKPGETLSAVSTIADHADARASVMAESASPPELWHGFLFAAQSVGMRIADGEIGALLRMFTALAPNERLAAVHGIEMRAQTGEYADAHFVPAAQRYLRERRWTAGLRPAASSKTEQANRVFEELMHSKQRKEALKNGR